MAWTKIFTRPLERLAERFLERGAERDAERSAENAAAKEAEKIAEEARLAREAQAAEKVAAKDAKVAAEKAAAEKAAAEKEAYEKMTPDERIASKKKQKELLDAETEATLSQKAHARAHSEDPSPAEKPAGTETGATQKNENPDIKNTKPSKSNAAPNINDMSTEELRAFNEKTKLQQETKALLKGQTKIGKVLGWPAKHPIAAGIAATAVVGTGVGVVTVGGKVAALGEDASAILDVYHGIRDFQNGKTQQGEKELGKGIAKGGLRRILEGMGIPTFLAAIISFIASLFVPGLVNSMNGGAQGKTQTPAKPAPVVDTAPVLAHTGPALALDAAGQADIKNLQANMRLNAAVSGYQGAADGQLTPDTIMGMQKTLAHNGIYKGAIDGKLSPALTGALNLNNDKVGTALLTLPTFAQLDALARNPVAASAAGAAAAVAPSAQPAAPAATLSANGNTEQIQAMQAILRTVNDPATGKPYYDGRISGQMDSGTLQALGTFRSEHPETKADGAQPGAATGVALAEAYRKDRGLPANISQSELFGDIINTTKHDLNLDATAGKPGISPTAYTPGNGATPMLQPAVLTTAAPQPRSGLVPQASAAALAAAAAVKNAIIPSANAGELPAGMRPHPEPAAVLAAPAHGKPQSPVRVPVVPPAPASTRLAANDNLHPHPDMPVDGDLPRKVGQGWFDNALNWANGGLALASVVPMVNEFAAAGQGVLGGLRFVGDMAEGRGLKASTLAAGSDLALAGADAIPVVGGEASLALRSGLLAVKGGRFADAGGHALEIARAVQPVQAAKKLGVIAVGTVMDIAADIFSPNVSGGRDATMPTAAPQTPSKPSNDQHQQDTRTLAS